MGGIFVEDNIIEDSKNKKTHNKENKNIYEEIIKLKNDDENNEKKQIINNRKTLIKKDNTWFKL